MLVVCLIVPVTVVVAVTVAVGMRGTGVTVGAGAAGVGELTGTGELGASVGGGDVTGSGSAVGVGLTLQASDVVIRPTRAIKAKGDEWRLECMSTSSSRRFDLFDQPGQVGLSEADSRSRYAMMLNVRRNVLVVRMRAG